MERPRSVPNVFDLRKIARRSIEASRSAPDSATKLLLAEIAFEASQLAECLDARSGALSQADLQFYAHLAEKIREAAAYAPLDGGNSIFEDLLDKAMAVMDADMGNVQWLHRADNTLRIVASRGFEPPFLNFFAIVDGLDNSACAFALHSGARVIVSDIGTSPFFVGKRSGDIMREAGVRAVQSMPMVRGDGNLIGMVSTHWRKPHKPSSYALARLDFLIEDAIEGLESAT